MTKKHVVALVLVLLMGIFVGSQCAMAASEQVEIRLMHFFTEGDARHGVMQHVLKEFAKNNPDIIMRMQCPMTCTRPRYTPWAHLASSPTFSS